MPFQLITDAATKLAPVTVRVKAAPSAVVFEGERDEIVGTPLLTGNVQVPELPPPGDGLVTVTLTDAALVISLAGTCAVSCVLPTNVVVRATPFQLITAPLTKFVPLAVKVKAAPPAFALAGDNEPRARGSAARRRVCNRYAGRACAANVTCRYLSCQLCGAHEARGK